MPIDLQPRLIGELIEMRPLLASDWDALYVVASDPLIWEQHPARDRYQREVFRAFFDEALDEVNHNGGALAVVERKSGCIIGSSRYHGYDPAASEVEIGWTFLARRFWGGRYNRQMKRLMLDHIFQFVDRAIFLVGVNNVRSQTAMERLGASRDGIVEQVRFDDRVSRSIRYAISRSQWHALAASTASV